LKVKTMPAAPVGTVKQEHRPPSWASCAAIILFAITGCASPGRSISYVPGQSVPIRSFTVELPRSPDWEGRDIGSVEEGIFIVFGRELD
jgi:hypothetical protein